MNAKKYFYHKIRYMAPSHNQIYSTSYNKHRNKILSDKQNYKYFVRNYKQIVRSVSHILVSLNFVILAKIFVISVKTLVILAYFR